jgi:uncharacterized membrane protein YedE/YeeE
MTLEHCPWYIAGPLFGLLIVGLRVATNRPFGALGGYVELAERTRSGSAIGFRVYLLVGLVIGGTLFAATLGGFSPTLAYVGLPWQLDGAAAVVVLLGAGAVMGFGARTAGGCTSGHGMCGMSVGSPASIAASMTFFGTAVLLSHVLAWVGGVR